MSKLTHHSLVRRIAAILGAAVIGVASLTACGSTGTTAAATESAGSMSKLFTCGTASYLDSIAWYCSDVYSLVINDNDTYELTYQTYWFGTTDPGTKALRTIIYTGSCSSASVEDEDAQVAYTLASPDRIYMEQHEKGVGRSAIAGTVIIDTDHWTDAMTLAYDPDTNSKTAEDFLAQFGEELTIVVEDPTLVPDDTTLSSRILEVPSLALVEYLAN